MLEGFEWVTMNLEDEKEARALNVFRAQTLTESSKKKSTSCCMDTMLRMARPCFDSIIRFLF